MQIVININENDYKTLMINGGNCSISMAERIIDSVYQGKKLQESILDKIRAEIEAKCCITVGRENDGAITLHDVFEIIDKYKAESEEKDEKL